jgi:uncharacterized membrane protein YfcA
MLSLFALFAVGAGAGTLGALLGLGGGIFLVPALTLLFNLPVRVAVGTSLVGVIATSTGVAAMSSGAHRADFGLALRLEVATTAGAISGGWLAGLVSARLLSLLFAAVVIFTAIYVLYKSHRRRDSGQAEVGSEQESNPHHWLAGFSLASLAGMVSGLLGVGGGFIKVPVMYSVMDVPLGIATATSNFMVGITAAASVFLYYNRGDIHPMVVIPTAMGIFLGAILGVRILPHVRISWLRTALVGLLVIMGVQMLLHGLQA